MRTIFIRIDHPAADGQRPAEAPDLAQEAAAGSEYPILVGRGDGSRPGWHDSAEARGAVSAAVLQRWREGRQGCLGGPEDLLAAGQELFGLLSCAFEGVWTEGDSGARIVLDIRPPSLKGLQWELLCDRGKRWLFCRHAFPAVRAEVPFRVEVDVLRVPIRLLIVVCTLDDPALEVEGEIDAIYAGLRGVPCAWDVDVLYRPRKEEFTRQYGEIQPHVLHFIGHGIEQGGALEVVPESGEPWALDHEWIQNALAHLPMPRLVVLNACRMHDAGRQRAVSGVMDGFLGHGIPAIVAMQGDIGTETARKFSGGFYRRLASGDPVDLAAGKARHTIHFSSGFPTGDWAAPTLTVQADPDSVLRLDPSCPSPDAVLRRAGVEFQDVRWLVDRSEDRRAVARLIDPQSAPANGGTRGGCGLVLVGGGMQVGKSILIKSYALTHHGRGLPFVYVTLPQHGNLSWIDFVERVAKAAMDWLGPEVRPLCDQFVAQIRGIEAGSVPPGAMPPQARPHSSISPQPHVYEAPHLGDASGARCRRAVPMQLSEDCLAALAQRFRGFVVTLAEGAPLLLVLDHVGCLEDVRQIFQRCVLTPAARGELSPARLVVVGRSGELEVVSPALAYGSPLNVKPFEKWRMARLAREYCTRKWDETRFQDDHEHASWTHFVDYIQRLADDWTKGPQEGVEPTMLLWWENTAAKFARWRPP